MKGAKKRAKEFLWKEEDGTYLPTGELVKYPDGFQFSFVRPEADWQLDDDNWDLLTEQLMRETGSIEHIGVFGGFPETSFRCMSKDQSMEYAKLFNQHSIFDLEADAKGLSLEESVVRNPKHNRKEIVDYVRVIEKILRDGRTL